MKKLPMAFAIALLLLSLTSCFAFKEVSKQVSYEDPETLGGKWTISFPTGEKYYHTTCTYWGTTDDTSVWTLENGTKLIQSGTVWATQEP